MTLDTNLYVKPGHLRPLGLAKPAQKRLLSLVRGLQHLERLLFLHLHLAYFSKGEREICQVAAFILGRVLSSRFNLPLSRTLPPEVDHLEIAVGIYAPVNLKEAYHQTFIKAYIGGKVLYIDPTFSYLNDRGFHVLVREHPRERFWPELTAEFKLEPYRVDHPAYQHNDILASRFKNLIDRAEYVETSLDNLHDPKLVREGRSIAVGFNLEEWRRVDRILRAIEPRASLPPLSGEIDRVAREQGIGHLLLMAPERFFKSDDD